MENILKDRAFEMKNKSKLCYFFILVCICIGVLIIGKKQEKRALDRELDRFLLQNLEYDYKRNVKAGKKQAMEEAYGNAGGGYQKVDDKWEELAFPQEYYNNILEIFDYRNMEQKPKKIERENNDVETVFILQWKEKEDTMIIRYYFTENEMRMKLCSEWDTVETELEINLVRECTDPSVDN